ncbi:Hsp70 family protein [Yinghuangia sp. ASG 101]|uniref:Hsp70 family protein n=1 Tax=Yinghuangia sp. ASG 101 TaxID=2896848 RepID=UPI001E4ED093|nr:Hsp70 family protein [Yinghuangia sp. ASG 101]UGQ13224.1 Hsp70 family protein [Yinghuangia sp. ASG 101]
MLRTLGIDLGTTNSVMAHLRRGEPEIIHNRRNEEATPSVVTRGRHGELLVGQDARRRTLLDAENVIRSVKRFMGRKFGDGDVQAALRELDYQVTAGMDGDITIAFHGRAYTPIEISAIILRRLKEDAELRAGGRFDRAVITVPAYFGERQVAATQEAGRMAGFHVLRIINEPTAAALAYGVTEDLPEEGRTVLVYDLGGGTFDISILLLVPGSVSVLGIEGDNLLGGDDFDRAISAALLDDVRAEYGPAYDPDRRDRPSLAKEAEQTKIQLSHQLSADVSLIGLGGGRFTMESVFDRARFEELIAPQIERTVELTRKAVREANLTVEDIDEVLLVGGSTAIPLVSRRLGEVFGPRRIRRGINPMQCVALGAAVQGALVADVECAECRAPNDLAATACSSCATSLVGAERVSCDGCHLPVPADAAACPKCGQSLSAADAAAPEGQRVPLAKAAPTAACPRCGSPAHPGAAACDVCGEALREASAETEPSGLRCPTCRTVNAPGAEACSSCGTWMQVTNPFDITPKNLGIELNDGRMAVIIPKNSTYPTTEPVSREFVVTGTGGRHRLEVAVYEGEHELAQQNELIGHLTMRLPDGTSGRTPVDVSFGLDRDRTITLAVRVHGGSEKTVKLERVTLDPVLKVQVEDSRRKLEDFTDRWSDELTPAEKSAARRLLDTLDDTAAGQTGGRSVDAVLAEARQRLEAQSEVRYAEAYLTAFIACTEAVVSAGDLDVLRGHLDALRRAREAGDWVAALDAAQRGLTYADELGHTARMLTMCRVFVAQDLVSPALAQRIRTELAGLEDAVRGVNMEKANRHLTVLVDLYAAAMRERGEVAPNPDDMTIRLEEA